MVGDDQRGIAAQRLGPGQRSPPGQRGVLRQAELVQMVREQLGAVASFRTAVVVQRLPKTRSGKILRATMRAIADGREFAVPSTIDDPAILDEIAEVLKDG